MSNKCLYCYKPIENGDFHPSCSKSFFGTKEVPVIPYSFSQMNELAQNVVERSVAVPGVQPKLSMSLINENSDKRLTVVGALGGNYIFKPPSEDFQEMPANEHLTMRIAEELGIKTVPSSLIRLQSGELSYITKRVDRTESGEKIHMLDMLQITEAFDKYRSSMEKIGTALSEYSDNPLLDKILFLELALFSFITGNNDMHLKNFSMIDSPSGWVLCPAYDLLNVAIVTPDDDEQLALTLQGKKKKLKREHFEQLGQNLELTQKQIDRVFKRLLKHKPKALKLIDQSFLSEKMKSDYIHILEDRYLIIYPN